MTADGTAAPHERIAASLEQAEVLAVGVPAPSPDGHPDGDAASPAAPEDDEHDPGEAAAPENVDWDLLRLCAGEAQNDVGNSRRLRHRFGGDIVHIQNVNVYAWDGRRWAEDIDGRVSRPMCHKVADLIGLEPIVMEATEREQLVLDEAEAAALPLADAEQRLRDVDADKTVAAELRLQSMAEIRAEINGLKATIAAGREVVAALRSRKVSRRRFAVQSGNAGKVNGMLDEAVPYLSRAVSDLDRDALAFNVGNGTLRFVGHEAEDLENPDPDSVRMKTEWRVVFEPHARADMISKLADVDYDPKATAPLFKAVVDRVLPHEPVRDFLQRYFGYGITALTREQVFVLLHGEGANGKSTIVDIVARLLADYSTSVPIATLVNDNRSGKGSEATPDLARLPGARLVRTAEPKEGMSFDESLIKGLTSGEPFPMRRLNKEFIDIYPTFKLIISANRKPTIKGNDDGIWRRVVMVPFDVQIPEAERDKQLPDKLWAERSGILNWLVEGCLAYLNLGGLKPPDEVTAATKEYREESDVIGMFVSSALEVTGLSTDEVESGELYRAFEVWCRRSSVTPFAPATFNRRMPKTAAQRGFVKAKSSISLYAGIKIRDEFKPRAHGANSGRDGRHDWDGGGD